jgi:hypothetical protein
MPPAVALTVYVVVRNCVLEEGRENVIDVSGLPLAVLALPAVDPDRVHVHVAVWLQVIVSVAVPGYPAKSPIACALPAEVPPAGVKLTFDLP